MDLKALIRKFILQLAYIIAGAFVCTAAYCSVFPVGKIDVADFMWRILFFCFLTELPVVVYYSRRNLSRREWNIRTGIHTVLLVLIMLTAGKALRLYRGVSDGLILAAIVLLIDGFVRIMTYLKDLSTADEINKKLKEKRKEGKS